METLSKTTVLRVINNKGTEEEAKKVAEWLATDEGQKWLAEAIVQDGELIYSNVLPQLEDVPTDDMLSGILDNIKKMRLRRIIYTCAAALVPCVVLIGIWVNVNNKIGGALAADHSTETLVIEKGDKKEIFFQDGSSVVINADSKVVFPHRFGLSERKVYLEGEAFFNVKSNNHRPFVVEMNNGTEIKVMGTRFNVSAYDENDDIDITLLDGCIRFSDDDQTITMSPNERLSYNRATGEIQVRTVKDAKKSILWTQNILVFRDTPLEKVLQTLERTYNISFNIIDEDIKEYSYTLSADVSRPLDEILADLESLSSVRFEKRGNIIDIFTLRKGL